jgi:nucleotide-binding universal stress UspA family protein
MSGVICAIRGGPHSLPTIDRAISLAKENACPLHFLYVVNIEFLSRTSLSRTHTVTEEIRQMGDFIVLAAQTRAEAQGVTARGVVREGKVLDEIVELCHETGSTYVVVGRPQAKREENIFNHELLQKFSQRIEKETRAIVIYPEEGLS